jgi:hypothetical protein
VHQAVDAGEDLHEGAEGLQAHHLALDAVALVQLGRGLLPGVLLQGFIDRPMRSFFSPSFGASMRTTRPSPSGRGRARPWGGATRP